MSELKKVKFRKNTNNEDRNVHRRDDDEDEGSPKAKSIHIIMRQDEEEKGRKITDQEKKNMKKQFLNIMNEFPEDEGGFEDS